MSTLERAKEIRGRISDLRSRLRRAEDELAGVERSCRHEWGEVVYDPIYHSGTPDRTPRDGSYVPYDERPFLMATPPHTEDRWTRTCRLCGMVQETRHTKDEIKKVPSFPGGA